MPRGSDVCREHASPAACRARFWASSLERSGERELEKYVNTGQSEPIRATRGWLELVGS